jgi:hypothetical protein
MGATVSSGAVLVVGKRAVLPNVMASWFHV